MFLEILKPKCAQNGSKSEKSLQKLVLDLNFASISALVSPFSQKSYKSLYYTVHTWDRTMLLPFPMCASFPPTRCNVNERKKERKKEKLLNIKMCESYGRSR
jgi:hypothetical protein